MQRNVWSSILLIALVAGLAYGLYATSPKWLPAAQGALAKPTPTPSEDQLAGAAAQEGMTLLLNPYADPKTGAKAWVDKVCGLANGPACYTAVGLALAPTPDPNSPSYPYRMTMEGQSLECAITTLQKLADTKQAVEIGRDPYPAQIWRVQAACKQLTEGVAPPPPLYAEVVKFPDRGWVIWTALDANNTTLTQLFPQGTPTFAPNEMMTPTS